MNDAITVLAVTVVFMVAVWLFTLYMFFGMRKQAIELGFKVNSLHAEIRTEQLASTELIRKNRVRTEHCRRLEDGYAKIHEVMRDVPWEPPF